MPQKRYWLRETSNNNNLTDTWSESNFSDLFRSFHNTVRFGKKDAGDTPHSSALLVLESDGDPIPRGSVIESAELVLAPTVTGGGSFNMDISFVADDGRWSQPGSGTEQWVKSRSDSHYDFNFSAENSGGSTIFAQSSLSTTPDGDVDMARFNETYLGSTNLAQSFTAEATGDIETTKLVIHKEETTSWAFAFIRANYYNTIAQDGSDDRPDIAGGSIGASNFIQMTLIGTSPAVVSFDHIAGAAVEVPVVSGTRYAIVLDTTWEGNYNTGHWINWSFMGNTSGTNLYPDGSPSTFGVQEGWNNINYPIDIEVPSVFLTDGTSVNVEPFGSVLRTPCPAFTVVSGVSTVSGLGEICQEWFGQSNYPGNSPIAICLGPGDAGPEDGQEFCAVDAATGSTDREDLTQLIVNYRRRRINRT